MAEGRRTFIIAEVGINANGDLDIAKEMVDVLADMDISAVKFQTFFGTQPNFGYLEFTRDEWKELFAYCEHKGLKWFSTPFDFKAIDFLNECGMDVWKIPSGMVTNFKYLKKIREQSGKFILSTGMCEWDEIELAYDYALSGREDVAVLHCVSVYPTPMNEVNLRAMLRLNWWGNYGLSDHTPGIEIPIAAVAMGATMIEKHFTLDSGMKGPDHKASLEPYEFREMVSAIRNVELAMSGDGIKKPTRSELLVRNQIRERMGCK